MGSYTAELLIYGGTALTGLLIFYWYLRRLRKESVNTEERIRAAQSEGLFEPMTLHPVIDPDRCIGSGACVAACPEGDILGLHNGRAVTVNASRCVGHSACFRACPVSAISLYIGTEKRGVELPHVTPEFETNVKGISIAGELGGMGLIKNATEQGKQAVEFLAKKIVPSACPLDLIIIGAGPAGISAALMAKKLNLKFQLLEQRTLGGTINSFPRDKIVMTAPMDFPLAGKVKLVTTDKAELISLWNQLITKYGIPIREKVCVRSLSGSDGDFTVTTERESLKAKKILLAIGRRGTPRRLGVPGEDLDKVSYEIPEPGGITSKHILIVGGGDSAIECALLLSGNQNMVTIAYRSEQFTRLKDKNRQAINSAIDAGRVSVHYKTVVSEIRTNSVILSMHDAHRDHEIQNNLVFILAGGELPTALLKEAGISIDIKYGEAILK